MKYQNILLVTAALLLMTNHCNANNRNGFVEYTNSINTATFQSIQTIGLFARGQIDRGEIVYGGLRFSHFDQKAPVTSSGMYQIALGVTMAGTYTPFLEIGTDFLTLFTSSENKNCGDENNCRLNAFIRAGLRIRFQSRYTLGVFHEAISFDETNSKLKGDHNYTGMSFSYDF